MSVTFRAETMCGAHKKRARTGCEIANLDDCHEPGHHCMKAKGERTDHKGAGNCGWHGGNSPNGEKHAVAEQAEQRTEKARQECERLGIEIDDGGPEVSLLRGVRKARGNVAFWEARCNALLEAAGLDALVGQVYAIAQREATTLPIGEEIRAAAREYREWFVLWTKTAKAAIDAGIAEREIALAESQADLIVRVIERAIEGLPEEEQTRRRGIAIAELRTLGPVAPIGSRN